MSVKIMSLIFDATIPDLEYTKGGKLLQAKASTVKLLLLAYADHANDDGDAAYPGYTRLEVKTALSRQGISNTLEAIRQNDLMSKTGISKRATNSYSINLDKLASLVKPLTESSHLTPPSQATLPEGVKPLDYNHPLTIPQPSSYPAETPQEPPEPSIKESGHNTPPPPAKPLVSPPDRTSVTLLAETDTQRLLLARVSEELGAKHPGGKVGRFPTLACKRKFVDAELRLGTDTPAAIQRALEAGCASVTRVVDYIAKWRPLPFQPSLAKIANQPQPQHHTTAVQAPDDWHP